MNTKLSRRQFLQSTAAFSAAAAVPSFWARAASALEPCEQGVNVILVFLDGGNDGLNTIIPTNAHAQRTDYEGLRPTIGIDNADLAATTIGSGDLALHPAMTGFKSLYDSGNLAVMNGVHYPARSLSHEESSNIWFKADPTLITSSGGWMGRTLEELCSGSSSAAVPAVNVDNELNPLFRGNTAVLAFEDLEDLVFPVHRDLGEQPSWTQDYKTRFQTIYNNATSSSNPLIASLASSGKATAEKMDLYALAREDDAINLNDLTEGTNVGGLNAAANGERQNRGFFRRLRTIYALMRGGYDTGTGIYSPLGCRVFLANIGGFDTHSNQGGWDSSISLTQKIDTNFSGEDHSRLLHRVSTGINALWHDLTDANLHQNTLIMAFSEFGRRASQNDSGTDHGTTGPMFVVGPTVAQSSAATGVVGGSYGAMPSLTNLDDDENFAEYSMDFRNVYAEVINQWLGLSVSQTEAILPADSAGAYAGEPGVEWNYSPLGFLSS